MSPELDLLERLCGEHTNLHDAAFGSCHAFRDIEHARKVISIYLRGKVVKMFERSDLNETPIPFYSARTILENPSSREKSSCYLLALTETGHQQFVEDSEGFFDKLFRNR